MKKKKNIKKTIICISLILATFVTNPQMGYCAGLHFGGNFKYKHPTLTHKGGNSYEEYYNSCHQIHSIITTSFDASTDITVDAYDKDGKNIMNSNMTISQENAIQSGTWVGINVKEEHSAYYSVNVSATEQLYKVTCNYIETYETTECKPIACAPGSGYSSCCKDETVTKTRPYSFDIDSLSHCTANNYDCPYLGVNFSKNGKVINDSSNTSTAVSEQYADDLEDEIRGILDGMAYAYVNSKSSEIEFLNTNDYDNLVHNKLKITSDGIVDVGDGYEQTYYYSPNDIIDNHKNKICINLKTSDITYNQVECNESKNEIEIADKIARDGNKYWHYFSPINTKSTNIFSIDIIGEKKFYNNQCINFINDHQNDYWRYIEASDVNISLPENNATRAIKVLEDSGSDCILNRIIIEIPIKQRFYNEIDGTRFKGFNFYYKPIDINNPFPNGLSDTSLWYDWKESDVKNPNLTESYNKTTYIAYTSTYADEIRNYKNTITETPNGQKKNTYTSWHNMNINGFSNFIGNFNNENIVFRQYEKGFKKENIYKLGCGPTNEKSTNEDNSTNYRYVEWCDKS